jgi:hypothetical protein
MLEVSQDVRLSDVDETKTSPPTANQLRDETIEIGAVRR